MESKDDEMIVVFEKEPLVKSGLVDDMLNSDVLKTLSKIDERYLNQILQEMWNKHGHVKRRGDMEEDTNFLQIIPYCLITRGNEVFLTKRLEGSGESRLVGQHSIGIGGHANGTENEESFKELIKENAKRELEEEVYVMDSKGNEVSNYSELVESMEVQGLMYSNKTEVDSVHLAIVYVLPLSEKYSVSVKETEVLEGSFEEIKHINTDKLENWSKSAIKVLK